MSSVPPQIIMNSPESFLMQLMGGFGDRVRAMFNAVLDAGIIRFRDVSRNNLFSIDLSGKLSAFGATPVARPSAYTQTYATANKTHDAALTDSTTGTAGTTLAAGAGVFTLSIPITLAQITGAGDVLTNYTPGYKFKILGVHFAVTVAVTTAGKAADLNLEIGTTNLTGGVVSLTSANCTPLGAVVAGTAVTAANTGSASDTISIESASVTAFAEGEGVLLIRIQNMDTADAIASLAANLLDSKQLSNSVIDDLQALGWLS